MEPEKPTKEKIKRERITVSSSTNSKHKTLQFTSFPVTSISAKIHDKHKKKKKKKGKKPKYKKRQLE